MYITNCECKSTGSVVRVFEKLEMAASIVDTLISLQVNQYHHDERYHKEIARLQTQRRLVHMTLHFAKYAGQLLENDPSSNEFQRIVTDTAIICISTANTLNLKLSDELSVEGIAYCEDLRAFGEWLARHRYEGELSAETLIKRQTIISGRMSAASEKLDHLEDYSFRRVFRDQTIALIELTFAYAGIRNWDLNSLISERLECVKRKNKLHGLL